MPASDLVRAAGEMGWFIFPLVIDNKTLTETSDGQWRSTLGPEPDHYTKVSSIEPLDILVGDCDAEVKRLSFAPSLAMCQEWQPPQTLQSTLLTI